jgi:Mn2+/Fe2+ NRAMP family transporter
LVAIQGISAGIGAVTGQGIAQNLRRHYPPWVIRFAVLLLLVANFINIGADLAAMGAALRLLAGGSQLFYAIAFGLLCAGLEILISYRRYVMVLKWLTLSLFAYVAVVLAVDVPWAAAMRGVAIPQFAFDSDHAMALVASPGKPARKWRNCIVVILHDWALIRVRQVPSLPAFEQIRFSAWAFPISSPSSSS